MSVENDPSFIILKQDVERIKGEVKGMKTDIKDDLGTVSADVKTMNNTLTDMKAITETMAENVRLTGEHQTLRADSHARDIKEIEKDNKKRDASITKNSQITGWIAAAVGAAGLAIFGAIVTIFGEG